MTKKASSRTIVDVIESTFNARLTKRNLKKLKLSPAKLHELSFAVEDYYKSFQIPAKATFELRPYIAAKLAQGRKLGLDYVFSKKHYDDRFNYKFDATISGEVTNSVKRYLLYCHSLAFQDALPYLLDFFRTNPNSEYAIARIPAIKALLGEYAALSEPIKRAVVIPLSGEYVGPYLTREEVELLEAMTDIDGAVTLGGFIRQWQHNIAMLEHRVDLFLPWLDCVTVLREMLKHARRKFTSKDIEEPFAVGILGEVSAVNPDKISIENIIKMRNEEILFEEWRTFLRRVFQKLYEHRENYTDLDSEFTLQIREEMRFWKDKLETKVTGASFRHQAGHLAGRIVLGAMSGAIAGSLVGLTTDGPAGATLGAIAGGVGEVTLLAVEGIKDFVHIAVHRPNLLTLRQHFLAIGAEI